ncbi:hypothetical protein JCM19296_529 [Nonlabens ulvanivorans]|uniref:Uncharacterized protein n=1 Tax=Nonlabens ulvanivorans TaxID=906888 RepID=A0A081D7Q5_NONUL|nr:hypothetical protein JCM19296_529 [Nonlabens ulvanivorans]
MVPTIPYNVVKILLLVNPALPKSTSSRILCSKTIVGIFLSYILTEA